MPHMFTDLPDLAAERLGGSVITANDEFFAAKENLLKGSKPEWREGVYTDRGKLMDGWETRRRRTPGHDWAIIRLGLPGVVRGVVIDTTWFTGNYPEQASLEGCNLDSPDGLSSLGARASPSLPSASEAWHSLLPAAPLLGNQPNLFPIEVATRVTHLRLNIFPDGGVARLRVHGEVVPNPHMFRAHPVDLAALANGGVVVAYSDRHYGNPQNMLLPGASTNMGDGWETRRRRGPGHDWAIVRLGRRGIVERVELDTEHFKGNAPGSCRLESCDASGSFDPDTVTWRTLVAEAPLQPDAHHHWEHLPTAPATHVRLNIYPDGGVSRLRLFGKANG